MKVQVVTRVTIAADAALIFKYLTNLKRHYLWNPHLQSITPMKVMTLGMKYKTSSLFLGVKVRGTNSVTKLLPNQELELENSTGALRYTVNYRLGLRQQQTLLTCTTAVYSESRAFAFAKPVLEALARRELQTDLQALKLAVEQRLK